MHAPIIERILTHHGKNVAESKMEPLTLDALELSELKKEMDELVRIQQSWMKSAKIHEANTKVKAEDARRWKELYFEVKRYFEGNW